MRNYTSLNSFKGSDKLLSSKQLNSLPHVPAMVSIVTWISINKIALCNELSVASLTWLGLSWKPWSHINWLLHWLNTTGSVAFLQLTMKETYSSKIPYNNAALLIPVLHEKYNTHGCLRMNTTFSFSSCCIVSQHAASCCIFHAALMAVLWFIFIGFCMGGSMRKLALYMP